MSVSASEKRKKQEEVTILESKPQVLKIEPQDEDSYIVCYDKLHGNPVHEDVDNEITESSGKDSVLAFLPNRSDEAGIQ